MCPLRSAMLIGLDTTVLLHMQAQLHVVLTSEGCRASGNNPQNHGAGSSVEEEPVEESKDFRDLPFRVETVDDTTGANSSTTHVGNADCLGLYPRGNRKLIINTFRY
jgi:hypothetical protein